MRCDDVAFGVELDNFAAYSRALVFGRVSVLVVEDRPGLRHGVDPSCDPEMAARRFERRIDPAHRTVPILASDRASVEQAQATGRIE
jgi:hypothetical protein